MKQRFVNLRTIFDNYKIINVPYYQREYVWGEKNDGRNLYKFIDDIFMEYKNSAEKEYFIGTLAFCAEMTNDVIDGQQRITSIILILTMLARLKCSENIKEQNEKLIMKDGKFIINEENYLTEEIKSVFGFENKFNSQGYSVNISKTIDCIKKQIELGWSGYNESWYDGLYNYILDK